MISTVHKHYFSKQLTCMYTIEKTFEKTFLSSYESKKNIWTCRQLKYHQLRIRSEIHMLLEIILNAFKCLTVSLSTQILILVMAPLSVISVSVLCEFAMLPNVYILLSPQEEEVHRCTRLIAHSSKRSTPLSAIILVCLGNT